MAAKVVLEDLKSEDMSLCESYVMSKQRRISFTKATRKLKKVHLEIIHTDV